MEKGDIKFLHEKDEKILDISFVYNRILKFKKKSNNNFILSFYTSLPFYYGKPNWHISVHLKL